MQLTIHTAAVESSDKNIRLYAALHRQDVDADLAAYCRENWRDEMPDAAVTIPSDPQEIIDAYFDADATHCEYLTRGEHFLTIPGIPPALTDRDLATILAALRLYQYEVQRDGVEAMENMDQFSPDCRPLTDVQVDDLCAKLNLPPDAPALSTPAAPREWMIMSPDHFPIHPEAYTSLDELVSAAARFPLRFLHQGFYRDGNGNHIPVADLPGLLRVVECEPDDDDERNIPTGLSMIGGRMSVPATPGKDTSSG
jgi:hypothetical protein